MDAKFLRADELGIRLEIVGGLPIWEPYPVYKHQKAIDRIRATIEKASPPSEPKAGACACIHASDVYINFPDGSLKRPDIAIFCQEPAEEEEAITLIRKQSSKLSARATRRKILRSGRTFTSHRGSKMSWCLTHTPCWFYMYAGMA